MWKSFLGAVRFILTKFDPVSSHGDTVRAKSYLFLTHPGWLAGFKFARGTLRREPGEPGRATPSSSPLSC